jgi:hypothetical protein
MGAHFKGLQDFAKYNIFHNMLKKNQPLNEQWTNLAKIDWDMMLAPQRLGMPSEKA